jgi:hypothetical protein
VSLAGPARGALDSDHPDDAAWAEDGAGEAHGDGAVVGRRLYLYFAGHGFAPTDTETALLMANATRTRGGHHIPGRSYAEWFYRAGYFNTARTIEAVSVP